MLMKKKGHFQVYSCTNTIKRQECAHEEFMRFSLNGSIKKFVKFLVLTFHAFMITLYGAV
jgi:hypothetical protein